MGSLNKYAIKALNYGFKYAIRELISILPNQLSSFIGQLGFTDIIKRSHHVNFIGNVFNTKLKITCQGNYAVERIAVARSMGLSEPFAGISQLGLKSFTMLDIGANVGAYSIGAIGIGAKKVFAIEPGPLFDRMNRNINLNLLSESITPIKIGLSSKAGKMRWHEDLQNPGNAHLVSSKDSLSFDKIPTQFGESFVEVDVITLDKLIESYHIPRVDLVKIDVEGMEWEVLSGGKEFIEKDLPIIVAETHRVASDMMRYDCITPLFNYLYSLGYESYSFRNNQFVKFIYPNFELDTFFIPNGFRSIS
jgi:FkbM family methyltransferase